MSDCQCLALQKFFAMKKKLLLIVSAFIYLTTTAQNEFRLLIQTDAPGATGTTFELPIRNNVAYDLTIDWGDGTSESYFTPSSSQTSIPHTYAADGQYLITITATSTLNAFHSLHFGSTGAGGTPNNRNKVLEIQQWGNLLWQDFNGAFLGCTNMNITATDAPNLSNATNMTNAFLGCDSLNANLNNWNVSSITSMVQTFSGCRKFNQPLNNWNVSNVTSFVRMFENCVSFNQNLNNWDVGNAQFLSFMFLGCTNFNGDVSTWNTSSTIILESMFNSCTNFNQPIGNWNVSNVTNMSSMFAFAPNFNQSLNNWNTANVTTMAGMFFNCTNFNGNISNWNTSSVSTMQGMFTNCVNFNQPIGNWNVGNVQNMSQMFLNATGFNQPIGSWNTSSVSANGFTQMFRGATSFNQPLNDWDVSGANNLEFMFNGCTAFNQDLNNWDVSNVERFEAMFGNCTNFNGNVTTWSLMTSPVSFFTLNNMFANCQKFDQDLSSWNLSQVTTALGFLDFTNITPCYVSNMMVAWSGQPLKNNVGLGLSGLRTNATGAAARQSIISSKGWVIDGGFELTPLSINTNPDCGSQGNGSVSLGFGGYGQFSLNDFILTGPVSQTTTVGFSTNFNNLPIGNYNITIEDRIGCQLYNETFSIVGENNPEVLTRTITPVSCTQDSTGAISITTSGDYIEWYDLDFNYINDGVNQIDDLPVGSYMAYIYGGSCFLIDTIEVALGSVDGSIAVTGNNISLTITEGIAPYVIVWTGPDGIINESGTELIGMPNGTYTATIRDASFCEKTFTATVSVGTSINSLANSITNIFPNPTKDVLHIELDKTATIEIFSITGVKLAELNGANKYQFNTSPLASGLYFVKAGEQTMKFVKN
jgi:surface protein